MKKGFTLIELLVVIAIIGIVSAVILSWIGKNKDKENINCEDYSTKRVYDLPKECFDYYKNKK